MNQAVYIARDLDNEESATASWYVVSRVKPEWRKVYWYSPRSHHFSPEDFESTTGIHLEPGGGPVEVKFTAEFLNNGN